MTDCDVSDILNSVTPQPEDSDCYSDGPSVEALIGAILGDKNTLSAEDLSVFESLIDDPKLDPEQRREFLQTVWNIVVCIINYQWDHAAKIASILPTSKSCEAIEDTDDQASKPALSLVKWNHKQCTKTYNEAAQITARRKGSL